MTTSGGIKSKFMNRTKNQGLSSISKLELLVIKTRDYSIPAKPPGFRAIFSLNSSSTAKTEEVGPRKKQRRKSRALRFLI
ncbi:hypothetical protein NPIL_279661, partial [Nephila pilipes]